MKLYSQADFDQSRKAVKAGIRHMLLFAVPFLVIAAAGFVLRIQLRERVYVDTVMDYLYEQRRAVQSAELEVSHPRFTL